MKNTLLFFAVLAISQTAISHEISSDEAPLIETGLSVYLSYSYRDKTYADLDTDWQIPGALMGGEALPVEDDAALDDATADYRYAFSADNGIQLSAEAHGGHGETEFKFAHYWYMHQWRLDDKKLRLEVGKMFAAFSPHANWHASQDAYSEASLSGDIFWGRSIVDTGIRGSVQYDAWQYGAELWRGDSWLADNGHAGDVFARYSGQYRKAKFTIGGWLLGAKAEKRRDTRYFGGHSHGNVVVTGNDAYFSGDILAAGIDAQMEVATGQQGVLRIDLSLTQLENDGVVVESQRKAALDSKYQSAQLGAAWQRGRHEIAARYERVYLDNSLSGSAAILVGRGTSLDNPEGIDPERTTISYRFHYNPNLSLRSEWVDETVANISQQRWIAGFVLRGFFE